jgi:uncharacterized protein (TIGR03085 family)
MTSLARRERHRLCDLALEVGPVAPTLSGDWNVKDLVVHLLVRERSLVGGPGILVPALSGLTDRVSARLSQEDFTELVERLRHPRLTWAAIPGVEQLTNTAEFFVHHEDIRRAQPDWAPRDLAGDEQGLLWKVVGVAGRGLVRPAGVPVSVENVHNGATKVLRGGNDPVLMTGPPAELLLFLYGRSQVTGIELSGPEDAIARLKHASLGI